MSEYKSKALVTRAIKWLRILLHDLGSKQTKSVKLFCDTIAVNPVFHEWINQIESDCHYKGSDLRTAGDFSSGHTMSFINNKIYLST